MIQDLTVDSCLTCGIPITGELYELVSEGWARQVSETHPVWLVSD